MWMVLLVATAGLNFCLHTQAHMSPTRHLKTGISLCTHFHWRLSFLGVFFIITWRSCRGCAWRISSGRWLLFSEHHWNAILKFLSSIVSQSGTNKRQPQRDLLSRVIIVGWWQLLRKWNPYPCHRPLKTAHGQISFRNVTSFLFLLELFPVCLPHRI